MNVTPLSPWLRAFRLWALSVVDETLATSLPKEVIVRLLITVASKHGSTAEIADFIAAELEACAVETTVLEPEDVLDLDPYDGIVIGSAVYTGYWMRSATDMVTRLKDSFNDKIVWLFSSGPLGDPPEPPGVPFSVDSVSKATDAIEHVVFGGAIDREKLGFGERAVVVALRVPDGDFRNWEDIRSWAQGIAAHMRASANA